MNTPPKVKLYTERTRAKDRTAKNRKGRNGRTQERDWVNYGHVPIGTAIKPNHQARAITKEGLDAIFTRSDVFLTVPAVDENNSHEGHTHIDEPKNRADRRRKARRTILNTLFRAGKKD